MAPSPFVVFVFATFVLYSCEAEKRCRGGPHDVVVPCGNNCEPSCNKPVHTVCALICEINACRCERGYYRRETDHQCVTFNECPQQDNCFDIAYRPFDSSVKSEQPNDSQKEDQGTERPKSMSPSSKGRILRRRVDLPKILAETLARLRLSEKSD